MKRLIEVILSFLALALFSLILTACSHLVAISSAEPTNNSGTAISTLPKPGMTGFGTLSLVEGHVIKLDSKMIHISTENGDVELDISASTVNWDGINWVSNIPTTIGDFITAWGIWNTDHSFTVQRFYVNIENLRGKVSNVIRGSKVASFDVMDQYQQINHINVLPLTEINQGGTGTKSSFQENPVLPQNGEYVEIVGRALDDGSISAVNITLP